MLTVVLVALLAWILVSVPVGLALGAMMRRQPAPRPLVAVRLDEPASHAS